jgi:hypothetical protein
MAGKDSGPWQPARAWQWQAPGHWKSMRCGIAQGPPHPTRTRLSQIFCRERHTFALCQATPRPSPTNATIAQAQATPTQPSRSRRGTVTAAPCRGPAPRRVRPGAPPCLEQGGGGVRSKGLPGPLGPAGEQPPGDCRLARLLERIGPAGGIHRIQPRPPPPRRRRVPRPPLRRGRRASPKAGRLSPSPPDPREPPSSRHTRPHARPAPHARPRAVPARGPPPTPRQLGPAAASPPGSGGPGRRAVGAPALPATGRQQPSHPASSREQESAWGQAGPNLAIAFSNRRTSGRVGARRPA